MREMGYSASGSRVTQIDAARGTAMLLVCLSHFALNYFQQNGAVFLDQQARRLGMVATPTFMMISGIMLGYLFQTRKEDFGRVLVKLRDRGLFYLLVGHAVIAISHIPRAGGWVNAFSTVYITDTIACCLILGPPLIGVLGPRVRIGAGAVLYFTGWLASLYWSTEWFPLELVRTILFGYIGPGAESFHVIAFSLVPWFAVYLACTPIGEALAKYQGEGRVDEVVGLLRTLAFSMVGSAIACAAALKMAKAAGWIQVPPSPIVQVFAAYQKLPPGPVYLLFYGGLGLGILYTFFRLPDRFPWRKFTSLVAMIGQASFFVFVLQYYIYNLLVYKAQLSYTRAWPLYFLGSIVLIGAGAWAWRAGGCNRYITLRWGVAAARPLTTAPNS